MSAVEQNQVSLPIFIITSLPAPENNLKTPHLSILIYTFRSGLPPLFLRLLCSPLIGPTPTLHSSNLQHSIRRILSLEKLKRLPDRETVMNRFSQPQFGDEYVSSPLANSSTRASQAGTPPTHRSSTPPVANSRNPQPPVAKNQPKQPQTRFSVNSNLMNYSMPKDEKVRLMGFLCLKIYIYE